MRLRDLLVAVEAGSGADSSAQAPAAPGPHCGPDGEAMDEGAGVAPLTPEKARKRAEKQQRLQQRLRAENERHASKERDLRSQIHGT